LIKTLLLLFLLALSVPLRASPDLSSDALLRDHLWRELILLPAGQRPTVGIALSAGSARATTHVGVIYVLENASFPIDVVAGTSMGAIVGALYAGGMPIRDIWKTAATLTLKTASNFSAFSLLRLLLSQKLLDSTKIDAFIKKATGNKTFAQFPKPFACVAMDLNSGESIIFRQGLVAPAVRASMNLPGFFEPVEYRQRYLVDGGVADYIPVDAARLLGARWVLASVAQFDYSYSRPTNVVESLERALDVRGSLLADVESKNASYVITPPVGAIEMNETNRIPEAVRKGVTEAYRRLSAMEESLLLFSLPSLMQEPAAVAQKKS
jgi:NTE family protein